MHAGWAAQSGLRAALLARAGFTGPRTVFEGVHGLFHGFANTTKGDYDALTGDFGTRWVTETLAFKPYPCGTMTHPYIDCARRLAARGHQGRRHQGDGLRGRRGHRASAVGAARRQAASAQRLCRQVLDALLHRRRLRARQCGLERFLRRGRARSRRGRARRRRCATRSIRTIPIRRISPATSAPSLADGRVVEERQPHMRGGAHEPLTSAGATAGDTPAAAARATAARTTRSPAPIGRVCDTMRHDAPACSARSPRPRQSSARRAGPAAARREAATAPRRRERGRSPGRARRPRASPRPVPVPPRPARRSREVLGPTAARSWPEPPRRPERAAPARCGGTSSTTALRVHVPGHGIVLVVHVLLVRVLVAQDALQPW